MCITRDQLKVGEGTGMTNGLLRWEVSTLEETEALEKQWREEFQALLSKRIQRFISYEEIESSYPEGLEVYLAARRKAQEEFNTYKRDFLNAEKCMCEPMPDICECAHCLHKMISRQDEEISQLKEELKRERSAVDFYTNTDLVDYAAKNDDYELLTPKSLSSTKRIYGKLARQTQQQRKVEL